MPLYDTYYSEEPTEENGDSIIDIQMKNGPCMLNVYWPGQPADIPDGVYLSFDGVVVILGGKVAIVTDTVVDKWGAEHNASNENDDLWKAIEDVTLNKRWRGIVKEIKEGEGDGNKPSSC